MFTNPTTSRLALGWPIMYICSGVVGRHAGSPMPLYMEDGTNTGNNVKMKLVINTYRGISTLPNILIGK